MRWCGRRATGAVSALLLAVALSGCSSSGPRPFDADPPSVLPTAEHLHPCSLKSPLPFNDVAASGQVSVDAGATAGVLVWLPGLNASICRAEKTSLDQQQAAALASDVRSASPPPAGTVNCPSDDGTAVVAYLRYSDASTQAVQFDLTGCAAVSAPSRSPRTLTDRLRRDLSPEAPPSWATYVAS